ncbi:hypothetical protein TEQG_05998 [Trichophyton equinum CBS 127.97]|uniref:Uncharacterized protein n=1 Tax=Trichophyton equinum (strain ATCC MYA-4606 / CBS 127.97) TaxID=559882 RepID=F2PYH7_TRIEC|nr:hypothetical protein TEQG_05998 [Trichophyton equinum CBS 127.97]
MGVFWGITAFSSVRHAQSSGQKHPRCPLEFELTASSGLFGRKSQDKRPDRPRRHLTESSKAKIDRQSMSGASKYGIQVAADRCCRRQPRRLDFYIDAEKSKPV